MWERETLNIVNDKDNNPYYVDSEGEYWRVYLFIEKTSASFDMVKDDNDFYQSAVAFGHFQMLVQSHLGQKRCMSMIANFHNRVHPFPQV